METRQSRNVYLIGSYNKEILGTKLPSYKQSFGHFLYLHHVEKKTIRESSRLTIDAVSNLWKRAGIPIRAEQHSIRKLESVFQEWRGLQKHKKRTNPGHRKKETAFLERLDTLFDIAHADALSMIKIPEDREFLLLQRKPGRPGSMAGIDKKNLEQQQRCQMRKNAENERLKRLREEIQRLHDTVELSASDSSAAEEESGGDDVTSNNPGPSAKKAKIKVLTSGLSAALDRTKMSSRNATYVLSEMVSSLGHDVSAATFSKSTIQRTRAKQRAAKAAYIKSQFSTDVLLTVHWDGKLMEDLTSHEQVDRLPILVSGVGIEQLLGVPKLHSGSGEEMAAAIANCLEEWNIESQVVAMCFDTTASNTGNWSGACTLIQKKLQKHLFHFACRHHVMELIVGAAFDKTPLGTSTGPEILIFKRFKDAWSFVDQNEFQMASSDSSVECVVGPVREEILDFARVQLQLNQPRDDYREFLELSMIFLGEIPGDKAHFKSPGALHRARWMAKVIYAIKMWIFRKQFKMSKKEEQGIRELATFSVVIHLKAWMASPNVVEAPLNDFRLMAQLLSYPHAAISSATSKKLGLHLWYLSEEMVGLALFDTRLSADCKKQMVAAMADEAPDDPPKRPRIKPDAFLSGRGLEQFCTSNSKQLLELIGFNETLLSKDPTDWPDDETFMQALKLAKGFSVVNDQAERGIALVQDYNKLLTKDEEQFQYLMQVVTEHRKLFPHSVKKNLAATIDSCGASTSNE